MGIWERQTRWPVPLRGHLIAGVIGGLVGLAFAWLERWSK